MGLGLTLAGLTNMAIIPTPDFGDPTLIEMQRQIEIRAQASNKKRDYIGASAIGDECVRKVWYDYNGYPKKPFAADTLMKFEDGHRTEELTAQRLRLVPNLQLITEKDGQQMGFSHFGGKFKGHVDGLILGLLQAPKTWHVWEHKACADKRYNDFTKAKDIYGEKQTLKNWDTKYYIQAQLYMHFFNLDRHYLTVSGAGGRGYQSCRTEYVREVALQYIDRAENILNAKSEPRRISDKPDFYLCRWCDFKDVCHK